MLPQIFQVQNKEDGLMMEYYGFAIYSLSTLLFGLGLLWIFVPDPIWHSIGLFYYPDR
jgi:phosphatidylinositol glycan class P protein